MSHADRIGFSVIADKLDRYQRLIDAGRFDPRRHGHDLIELARELLKQNGELRNMRGRVGGAYDALKEHEARVRYARAQRDAL